MRQTIYDNTVTNYSLMAFNYSFDILGIKTKNPPFLWPIWLHQPLTWTNNFNELITINLGVPCLALGLGLKSKKPTTYTPALDLAKEKHKSYTSPRTVDNYAPYSMYMLHMIKLLEFYRSINTEGFLL